MGNQFEEKLYPGDVAMSPRFALRRFGGMLAKYGHALVETDQQFQKAREVWIASMFLLGLGKSTGKDYWVQPEHVETTPDAYGLSVGPHPEKGDGYSILEKLNLEITEWEEHAAGDLADAILTKLGGKAYPSDFILLVHARKPNEMVDPAYVQERLAASESRVRVGQVWLVGRLRGEERTGRHVISRLFPKCCVADFVLKDEFTAKPGSKDMMRFSRGTGDGCLLIDSKARLPLPDLDE